MLHLAEGAVVGLADASEAGRSTDSAHLELVGSVVGCVVGTAVGFVADMAVVAVEVAVVVAVVVVGR